MADTPEALIAGHRIAISVMREALDAERARSDARLVALAEILAVCLRARDQGANAAELAAVEQIAESCMPDRGMRTPRTETEASRG